MSKGIELKMMLEIVREGKKIEKKSCSYFDKNDKSIKSSSDKVDKNAKYK